MCHILAYCKVMAEWSWRYRSVSKVITRYTLYHASDHLYPIWKESIQNCKSYRVDTEWRTDGRTSGRTDGAKPIYPPTTSLCWGYKDYTKAYIYIYHRASVCCWPACMFSFIIDIFTLLQLGIHAYIQNVNVLPSSRLGSLTGAMA